MKNFGLRNRVAHFLALLAIICLASACAVRPPVPDQAPAAPVPLTEPRTLALLGATGMVGGYLLEEALERGYRVRALVRTPARLDSYRERITLVEGNALDPAAIEELLRGSDVVISALGPVKADGAASKMLNSRASEILLRGMGRTGVSQYIVVSGAGVRMPGDDRDLLGWWVRTLARVGLADALRDKQAEYDLLADSEVDWMLVRCPLIDPEPFRGTPMVSVKTPPAFRLRAGELSRFIFDQVEARQYIHQGPFLGSR